jgi:L-seryl-tRNA(Ser) seleniumtransferase
MSDARRTLPAVGTLLERDDVRAMSHGVPHALLAEAVRQAIGAVRGGHQAPPLETGADGWGARVAQALAQLQRPSLRPVLNATGVVLHTNLGRAPLAAAALDAIARTAGGACNLEYDIEQGSRGSRYTHCVSLLCELTGAEDAIVVNNCAAALVLALNSVADGREAIVSRGELVEIGGSFRVPDIMAKSGAVLREVGTTNRTHLRDYADAMNERTAAVVKVHRSNFSLSGFVAEATVRELSPLATEHGVPLLYDFGSGLLADLSAHGLHGEPTARDAVRDGATLTLMSGDKLLGGPQAGILVGSRNAIDACRRNPLCRALRVDKLTLAALEATLALYRDPVMAVREIPALAMLTAPPGAIRERAEALGVALRHFGIACEVAESEATVGGGAFPTARIPSAAIVLAGDAVALDRALRGGEPAVVGRIERHRLWLDLRSLLPSHDAVLQQAVIAARAALRAAATTAATATARPTGATSIDEASP